MWNRSDSDHQTGHGKGKYGAVETTASIDAIHQKFLPIEKSRKELAVGGWKDGRTDGRTDGEEEIRQIQPTD